MPDEPEVLPGQSAAQSTHATSEDQHTLKARLIGIRDRILSITGTERENSRQILWFDAELLRTVLASRARKWSRLKSLLNSDATPFDTGILAFSNIVPTDIKTQHKHWIAPASTAGLDGDAASRMLEDAAKIANVSGGEAVLVSGNLEISTLAQKHGFLVVHPEQAHTFVDLQFGSSDEENAKA